ncbi:2-dehydro-3-deoxy-phosphogluconate aldolase [Spirochaetia bacterium]|nr:2-dehydro-3-deoxy-phosphogluconate aldolase [Spirochaetia bacterium]
MTEKILEETGVIAIIRNVTGDDVSRLAEALFRGGIGLMEVTMNTEGAEEAIRRLRKEYEGKMCVGAGTVTDRARALAALDAGAEFTVTPNLDYDVIKICRDKNIPIFPGVFTPTEICSAMNAGCKYIKLFPADSVGAPYIKSILSPLNNAKIIAVGGINAENAESFFRAGAVGIGVGGSLCRVPQDGNFSPVTELAHQLIETYKTVHH